MKKVFFLILVLIILSSGVVLANSGSSSAQEDSLIIKTGHLKSSADKIEGSDGMTMIKGDVTITADQGTYYQKDKKAEINGNVILIHDKGKISSKSMEAMISTDKYIFRDDVKMTQQLAAGKFQLASPYLELEKQDNSFQASKGVTIKYNGRTLKGENVSYNDQQQTLELTTNVYIEKENGDWIKSNHALFYLETEAFTAEGSVELEIDISTE